MTGFWNELRIIPRIVWPIALLIAAGSCVAFYMMPGRPPLSATQFVFIIWAILFVFSWVLLIGYINADARRRGMHYITWTLLALFVPNFLGAVLYFVLRDPLLVLCPRCGARGRSIFVFCHQCGSELAPSCPSCKRAVQPGWNRCVYCGKGLDPTAIDPMPQANSQSGQN
jgi:hypothetical protein